MKNFLERSDMMINMEVREEEENTKFIRQGGKSNEVSSRFVGAGKCFP